MIVYNLCCSTCNITFEGWFDSSNDYMKQKRQKILTCPSCNSLKIEKALMAPNLNKKSNQKQKKIQKTVATKMNKLKKYVEKNFDYVGDKFTDEAKKIKYGETKERSIYGEATLDQTKELIDEDIDIMPLPFSPKKTN